MSQAWLAHCFALTLFLVLQWRVTRDLPLPHGLAPSETTVWDHGDRLNPPPRTENPRNKGFSGSGAPNFGLVSQTPRPRGRGRPLFDDCNAELTRNIWGFELNLPGLRKKNIPFQVPSNGRRRQCYSARMPSFPEPSLFSGLACQSPNDLAATNSWDFAGVYTSLFGCGQMALLGPYPWVSFCLVGRKTGFCETPFYTTPFSWFLMHQRMITLWAFNEITICM